MTMTHIETVELGSAAASITFSSIPQTYTDLVILLSEHMVANGPATILISFNGSTSDFSGIYLEGSGSSAASGSLARYVGAYHNPTADTFGSKQIYISNYTSSNAKSFSSDSVTENNGTEAYQDIIAGLWDDTSAITSITLGTTQNFDTGSSASLYGIS